MNYIIWFDKLTMKDVGLVGGKNASLGQMIQGLKDKGIQIPNGFAVTSKAYWHYLSFNELEQPMRKHLNSLKKNDLNSLRYVGTSIRKLISSAIMPDDLAQEIQEAYAQLSKEYDQTNCDVAVRSSATAEDLPTASFAGQQETFLNIQGKKHLIEACKKSFASLFTDRAISYRIEKGFNHFDVALSIGVQKMVHAKSAGVAFSLDTQTGFENVIAIDSSFGLGESIVQGVVTPDEFLVFKPTLQKKFKPIIKKKLGDKKIQYVFSKSTSHPIKKVAVSKKEQAQFSLSDDEVISLAHMVQTIDDYYSQMRKKWMPMDVEWAKDNDGTIYILQARPETVHSQVKNKYQYTLFKSKSYDPSTALVRGLSIGQQIVSGIARIVKSSKELHTVKPGEILVTKMTDPDWVPIMKKVAGIVTDLGGRTCHAAIVSRELHTPAIVGTDNATRKIKTGQKITIDCSKGAEGFVLEGFIPFEKQVVDIQKIPKAPVEVMLNIADPDNAFSLSKLPVSGVGLARVEFIITNMIGIHPMAILQPEKVKNKKTRHEIEKRAHGYANKQQFFIDTLAQGIGMIAAGFYPRPVIVRLSDFKTNEYRNLLGGEYFEQEEANPMIGFRGASRYTHESYKDAFHLECSALHKVRDEMGLDNVMIMIPFVRTIKEAERVITSLGRCGIKRGLNALKLVMMCEIPSNVILIDQFSKLFDGFSIGSNDLAQLTLGIDRDSAILADLFDERDAAVKQLFIMAITGAHRNKRFIGICGQAPSDYPELADFLIKQGIDSISLNSDSVIPFLLRFKEEEE